jgi:hypothetical protein
VSRLLYSRIIRLPLISDNISENIISYRKTFESCEDYIWFEDRFLNFETLALLKEIIENLNVNSIRILTSLVRNDGINEKFLNDIKNLVRMVYPKGITLEVRVVTTIDLHRKVHDRYLLGSNILWSLPPVGSVLEGQSSAFKEFRAGTSNYEQASKDYMRMWNDPKAFDILTKSTEIKALIQRYEIAYPICGKKEFIRSPLIPGKVYYCQYHYRMIKSKKHG